MRLPGAASPLGPAPKESAPFVPGGRRRFNPLGPPVMKKVAAAPVRAVPGEAGHQAYDRRETDLREENRNSSEDDLIWSGTLLLWKLLTTVIQSTRGCCPGKGRRGRVAA